MKLEERYRSQFRQDPPKGDPIDYSGRMTAEQKLELRHRSQFQTWPTPATASAETKKGKGKK